MTEAAGYVAAMVDGEGTIAFYPSGRGHRRAVVVCNTERDIIDGFVDACRSLGIATHVYGYQDNRCGDWSYRWDVAISGRANLERFGLLVSLRSARKRTRFQEMMESYKQLHREWSEVPVERLRDLYKRLSMQGVATELGVSLCTVHRWIHRAGIVPRPKGRTIR